MSRRISSIYPDAKWKKVGKLNTYLCNLLPHALLRKNFKLEQVEYIGIETIFIRGVFVAVSEGKICLNDELQQRKPVTLSVEGKTIPQRSNFSFVLKAEGVLRDVYENLSFLVGDRLVFYVQKTILLNT